MKKNKTPKQKPMPVPDYICSPRDGKILDASQEFLRRLADNPKVAMKSMPLILNLIAVMACYPK